jgi:primase-polymerase (primpol)-like protein
MIASTTPRWLPVVADAIPRELRDIAAWYPAIIRPKVGKVGKWDKRPGNPATGTNATWSDPTTRCTFSTAFTAYESHPEWFDGIGFMMHTESGLIGIDLDTCISADGTIAPWALEVARGFPGAYWERSISGTGLRGFCKGTLPVGGVRSKIEGNSVELYADERFLVVTGQAVRS